MYGELASVRGIVDLSLQDALDKAKSFLTRQGYMTVRRADNTLTAERRPPEYISGQPVSNLMVKALPQPEDGDG